MRVARGPEAQGLGPMPNVLRTPYLDIQYGCQKDGGYAEDVSEGV